MTERKAEILDLDAIPRSELPGLPSKWSGPWEVGSDGSVWGMVNGRLCDFAFDMSESDAIFLAALLNTCYPVPTATENGAGK